MALTRTFKVSGLGCLASVALLALAGLGVLKSVLVVLGTMGTIGFGAVFAVSATAALFRGILWRVGSRLFVSYALLGVVPFGVFLGIAYAAGWILASQLGVRRAEAALTARRQELRAAAEAGSPRAESAVPAEEVAAKPWITAQESFLTRRNGIVHACATGRGPGGARVVCLPLDHELRTSLGAQIHAKVGLGPSRVSTTKRGRHPRKGVSFGGRDQQTNVEFLDEAKSGEPGDKAFFGDEPPVEGPGLLDARYVWGMLTVREPILDWDTGTPRPAENLALVVNTSFGREYRELFGETRIAGEGLTSSALMLQVLRAMLVLGLLVYVTAALLAGVLVFRIARASRRLSVAFDELGKGNFAHRAALKGGDQLASLIHSFNRMAGQLQASVAERAEREALEHELGVARDLQRRLLPPHDFRFAGVEIATDFRPAAAIGGDFYYLAAEGTERLVVAIADVSGHGLSTGIVMASARASLAALSHTGLSAADLFTALDAEVRASTDARTFVTLSYARFRLNDGIVEVTNAGHLYPYRITAGGVVSAVQNPARPLGVTLPVEFVTVTAPVAPGDLWVFLSDGVIEAAAPGREEEFGFARLEAVLGAGAGFSAAALRDAVLKEWRAFTGGDEPEDDRTLIVLRIEGA